MRPFNYAEIRPRINRTDSLRIPTELKEFVNATDLTQAATWIRQKLASFDTSLMRLHLKRHRRKDQVFSGYCRYDDFLVVAAIHQRMPLPFLLQKPIGSVPNKRRKRGFDYIWHEQVIETAEQALVWVAGHESWHYLCKTGQMKGNWETRANRYGFAWSQEYTEQYPVERFLFDWLPIETKKTAGKLKVVYG